MIDLEFDCRKDSDGEDPDWASPTLKRFHQLFWSKPLPQGGRLTLSDKPRVQPSGYYLYATVDGDPATEQAWSSDGVCVTHARYERMRDIIGAVPDEVVEDFYSFGCTPCSYLLWPGRPVEGRHTINQARGIATATIGDRLDLTLECVRRFYLNPNSSTPLSNVLGRYPEFFELFGDFRGYTDFWLLQDFVSRDYSEINFFLPFNEFTNPYAQSAAEWNEFRINTVACFRGRLARLQAWAVENVGEPLDGASCEHG